MYTIEQSIPPSNLIQVMLLSVFYLDGFPIACNLKKKA